MNFEKIEMLGFKSFADKVVITFENGVTGIVGPNGCGKSNIADAIRWVLGELSAKNLRGSSMTDVIFSGTEKRKALSYCEVSLYFDNSQKIFKSCEYSEVILTRKLFKNGESEYYINKQPALLKDIVSLLHECGVSKSGYTIIGQGKVSELLSSKPEDRRGIFEEAVGISQTKQTKNEAVNKLNRTHENLVRIIDIRTELENNIEPLQRAAEKTKKFLELSEELKYQEINAFLYKSDSASNIKEKINLRITGLNEECEHLTSEYNLACENYEKHMTELTSLDKQYNQLHEMLLEKSVSQEKLSGQTKVYNERISFFKSEITRLEEDNAKLLNKIKLFNDSILEQNKYIDSLQTEKKELSKKQDDTQKELTSLLKELNVDEKLNKDAQSSALKAAENLADISQHIGSLSTEKSVLTDRQQEILDKIKELTDTRHTLDSEYQSINKEIEELTIKRDKIAEEKEKIEGKIKEINELASRITNEIFNIKSQISSDESNKNIYVNLKNSFDGYPFAVKNLMQSTKVNQELSTKVKGVVSSILSTDKKYETAIQIALGNSVQHVVTSTPDDAKYLIEYLKKNDGGRVTFLPVSSVKPHIDSIEIINSLDDKGAINLATKLVNYEPYYENIIRFLLGNTLIVDNIESAVNISKKHKNAFKIVTLDGDIINPSGSMTGGSQKQNQSNLLSTDRKIEELTTRIDEFNKKLAKNNEELDKINQNGNNLIDELNTLTNNFENVNEQISKLTLKLNSIKMLIDANEDQLNENNSSIESLTGRLNDLTIKYADAEKGTDKLVELKTTATSDIEKRQGDYEKRKVKRDELLDKISNLKLEINNIEGKIDGCKGDIERFNDEISNANNSIEANKSTVETDKDLIEKSFIEIEKITKTNLDDQQISSIRDNLDKITQKKVELNDLIKKEDQDKSFLNSEINKNNDKKHDEELELAKVDSELEYLGKRVNEEYGETYESCLSKKDPNFIATTSDAEISKLRHRISSLGSINANAIEDYNNQSERYEYYKAQQEDLEKAENDMKEAIKKLDTEMLAEFNAGFEEIRTHFKKIFKELFGGGTADLIMDYQNTDDPLKAGVEIVAEPPGKKLQKISLLSGGEMSLTAIAILFAILKLRPMPFCVLDEIEAALDDANVERFANYLKKFSNETQFIVITHKKVTMELSDALFGVTMQEKGVSNIVSVKLSDINETFSIEN